MRKAARQIVPPDVEGVWVRIAYGQRRVFHFTKAVVKDRLECAVPGMVHGPESMHEPGYEWEGPYPVPGGCPE